METLNFDLSKKGGAFKKLNATTGGPWHKRHTDDQYHSNFELYKAARIPFARNHDCGYNAVYGGPFAHDITKVFPNFDADENDPASYDFACTDECIIITREAGTETFFRLGESIEHHVKKHATLPPKDFHKWARICEHVIRHYNEGWANGFNFGMKYWEIWCEPDLQNDDSKDKELWGGTRAQFYDFFEIAAKHLKACFPDIKIGGPGLTGGNCVSWASDFIPEMKRRNVPIDFLSWHSYANDPAVIIERAEGLRKILDENGYENAESILDEYNYIRGWTKDFIYSIKAITGMKGAAFMMATMSEAQKAPIDMLMYYDTRPCVFNGVFNMYTCEPFKGYYPMSWYAKFYDMKAEVRCENNPENIYSLCGVDEDDKVLAFVTYYTETEETAKNKEVHIDFGKTGEYEIYLLDESHDAEFIKNTSELTFDMAPNTCIFIKEK